MFYSTRQARLKAASEGNFGKAEIFLSQCKIVLLFSIKFLLDIALDVGSFAIFAVAK